MRILLFLLFGVALSVPLAHEEEKIVQRNPTLLISLDGFRADKLNDYIKNNPSTNFLKIIDYGVKADYMVPSFPTLTFP
jgi:predicted AlkP superfamily pyrophosphatase or phosphodiesterase